MVLGLFGKFAQSNDVSFEKKNRLFVNNQNNKTYQQKCELL
jgi:hypothetical protein